MRIHRPNYRQKPSSGTIDWAQSDARGLKLFFPFFAHSTAYASRRIPDATGLNSNRIETYDAAILSTVGGYGLTRTAGVSYGGFLAASGQLWEKVATTYPFTFGIQVVGGCLGTGHYYGFDGEGGPFGWQLWAGSGDHVVNYARFSSDYYLTVAPILATPRWIWVVLTSTQIRTYYDAGLSGGSANVPVDLLAGVDFRFFNGASVGNSILQLRLYNRELSVAEMQQIDAEPWRIIAPTGVRKYWFPSAPNAQFGRPFRDVA